MSAEGGRSGNVFLDVPGKAPDEQVTDEQVTALLSAPNVEIERIVSTGQASPPGFWYNQDRGEWVILLAGSAGLLIEGEPAPRHLKPGDYLHLPAHKRHRVEWTDAWHATIWLAVRHG